MEKIAPVAPYALQTVNATNHLREQVSILSIFMLMKRLVLLLRYECGTATGEMIQIGTFIRLSSPIQKLNKNGTSLSTGGLQLTEMMEVYLMKQKRLTIAMLVSFETSLLSELQEVLPTIICGFQFSQDHHIVLSRDVNDLLAVCLFSLRQ